MPKYEFWFDASNAIQWPLPTPPAAGDVVDFGSRGRWRVVGPQPVKLTTVDGNFEIVEATPEDGEPINDPLRPYGLA